MRPLELRLRNFRSYAGEHTFSFAGRSLVGVVGPIGSGKSSILDAIVFALYGRTPRIATATKTLINQRAADASVVLRFEVEGELWEAARSIRIKGPSRHALYRYDDPSEDPIEKLTLEGEVNERIVQLLGLDFSAFERSVLLAQGRFAEFLQARPADRDRVLKGVFGHDRIDRMKALAKDKRDVASVELEKLSVRIEGVDRIRERLEKQREDLSAARTRREELADAATAVEKIDRRLGAAIETAAGIAKRLSVLNEHAGRLPDQEATGRSLEDAAAAEGQRAALAAALDEAQQAMQAADAELAKANADGEPQLLERAGGLLAAADPQLKAVVEADRRITSAKESLAAADDSVTVARRRQDEAEHVRDQSLGRAAEAAKILEDAEEALDRARHADMAATLRSDLEPGDTCPVCKQPVAGLPEQVEADHLDELQSLVESARRTKIEVDKTYTSALTTLERTREQVEASVDRASLAQSQLSGAKDDAVRARGDLEETSLRLEKILGPGDPADHLQQRRNRHEQLVQFRENAQRRVEQIRGQHDQSIRDEQEAAKSLQELSMKLADLAARLEIALEIGDDAGSLGSALARLRREWSDATTGLREELSAAEMEKKSLEGERSELLAKLGVSGEVTAAVAVIADRIDRLETSMANDTEEVGGAADLISAKAELEMQVETFGRINGDLTDSKFIRFLLDDERSRLAELGSEHFQRLSAGRYRFFDDKFAILDLTAADAVRRSDSLSGGETFLASLGLALALAEMVAGIGGRLDAFFLDEGFGTLDPEHLDLAMEGVETLVADQSDRLVVIVSHVPEMRERIGDLIVLERVAATGDTKVVSG